MKWEHRESLVVGQLDVYIEISELDKEWNPEILNLESADHKSIESDRAEQFDSEQDSSMNELVSDSV